MAEWSIAPVLKTGGPKGSVGSNPTLSAIKVVKTKQRETHMRLSILLSSAILFATTLTPSSAYADDQNLQCRRMANGCDLRGSNGRLSISGFDINVNTPKSSDRGNRNRDSARNAVAGLGNHDNGNENNNTVNNDSSDNNDNTVDNGNDNVDTPDTGNDVADNTPGNNDTGGGGNNTSPPQHNSHDIKGFDPFGGLYGPGT